MTKNELREVLLKIRTDLTNCMGHIADLSKTAMEGIAEEEDVDFCEINEDLAYATSDAASAVARLTQLGLY